METTDEEVTEYYSPRDLLVGETVFVLGRRFLIFDCDSFTRQYYKSMLGVEQPPRIEVHHDTKKEFPKSIPPHIGIGAPEDTLQSCYRLVPKPPHKDIIKYNLNANKYLRYLCELDWIHPEDKDRQFILSYSLADGTLKIGEVPRRNSGIREGRFLKAMRLQTPDSDPNFPTYFTPDKFYIGAIVPVFKHRFKIVGCDLFVYRYMSANQEKFPQEVIDNVRNYHMREGNLKDELKGAIRDEHEAETRAQLAKIGQAAVAEPSDMERCLTALNVVEGSATPPRPHTPPVTTDRLAYDDTLRINRLSKPTCDNMLPLKGILKSGAAREDHQRVVCFSGPKTEQHQRHPPGLQPHYDEDPHYCDRFKDVGAKERAERRAADECAYDLIPSEEVQNATGEDVAEKPKLPGYLGTYDVDCKEVPDYMRLSSDAYEKIKHLRREVPEISPQAARMSEHPRQTSPPVESCLAPAPAPAGPCTTRKEDVSFSCPRVEPGLPCCDPDKRE